MSGIIIFPFLLVLHVIRGIIRLFRSVGIKLEDKMYSERMISVVGISSKTDVYKFTHEECHTILKNCLTENEYSSFLKNLRIKHNQMLKNKCKASKALDSILKILREKVWQVVSKQR